MASRTTRRDGNLGTTLLLWGIALLGALFVLSIVVAAVISIVTTIVAIVTTVATALLLAGIAYLAASRALGGAGSGRGDRARERPRSTGTEYGTEAGGRRRTGETRSDRERGDGASLLGRIPGLGSGSDDAGEPAADGPIDRLTEQYVRGEIGEAEYERRLERHLERPETPRRRTGERSLDREYER